MELNKEMTRFEEISKEFESKQGILSLNRIQLILVIMNSCLDFTLFVNTNF